jgi:beta-galactosidase
MIEINFNTDWKFYFEQDNSDRSKCSVQKINLPHDFSISQERCKNSKMAAQGGFFQGGVGIYEKKFIPKPNLDGKEVFIAIDGAYQNCEVYINDNLTELHHYGYTKFFVNITSYILFERENKIKIIVNNDTLPNSNWYTGSGIFRNVSLHIAEKLHIIAGETFVYTKYLDNTKAVLHTNTKVKNEYYDRKAYGIIVTEIEGRDGKKLSTGRNITLEPHEIYLFEADITIENPTVWNMNVPQLYTLVNKVIINGRVIDKVETKFGIRTIEMNALEGFKLNARPMKLKGCCIHHDNGPIGACSFRQAELRKVERLKKLGYNAVRTVHNPPSEEFLEACDRLGMLVIEEIFDNWQIRRVSQDHHIYFREDYLKCVEECVNRDKNHASVIMWSTGNEVEESNGNSNGELILQNIIAQIRKCDSQRPITNACVTIENYQQISETFCNQLDVVGYNYAESILEQENNQYPERILCSMASYPHEMAAVWSKIGVLPYVIGDFSWTGMDYLGEAGLGRVLEDTFQQDKLDEFPCHISNCGDLDICGFIKPQGEYRRIMWGMAEEPYIGVVNPSNYIKHDMFTKWGWENIENSWSFPKHEGDVTKIYVYANADEVELILNGKTIGKKVIGCKRPFTAEFEVAYESGTLECLSYKNGLKTHKTTLTTCKEAYGIRLRADRTEMRGNTKEIAYITCEIVDEEGSLIPYARDTIQIAVKGDGVLLGAGNGDAGARNHYQSNVLKVYKGKALLVVRGFRKGEMKIEVKAEGLQAAECFISLT